MRWLSRFTRECAGATLAEALTALEALDALPDADAQTTLTALLHRHGAGQPSAARTARASS